MVGWMGLKAMFWLLAEELSFGPQAELNKASKTKQKRRCIFMMLAFAPQARIFASKVVRQMRLKHINL